MQAKDPRSSAPPEPARQHLTSPATLLGLALAVIITLVLIFPGRGLLTTASKQQADAVSLTYLGNMARNEPANPELRFTLAQKQVELGKIAEARAALEPLYNSPDPAVRQRARLADFKLQMQQMQTLPAGSKDRENEMERLRQELVAMSQYEWEVAGLLDLADVANQLGARKLRAQLYARIVRSDNKFSRQWLDDVARKALADGEYLAAAEMHFTALARAENLEDQRHYFRQAIGAYQAGNMVRESLLAAEAHIGPLANDDETLVFMIRLARQANDMKRAQVYAKRLLRMSEERTLMRWLKAVASFAVPSAVAAEPAATGKPPLGMRPYDKANYELAYEVFLANRNLQDAYRVAKSAVQQVPNDMRWRERLAQISEWTGKSGEALEQWLYIARRTGSASAWQAVLRIAPGAVDDEVLLEAMRYQSGKVELTDAQWRAIAAAYERVGRPKEGIEFLEQEYKRRPRPGIQESLASLYERTGDAPNAIRIYRQLVERSATTDRVTTLASLLMTQGEFKAAYDVLERHRTQAPADDAEYLRLLGDLALRLRDQSAAQVQYERLVAHPKANLDDYVRLVNLLAPRQPEAAARLAEAAYRKFGSAEMLLTALAIHSQRRDFGALRRLFASVPPDMERELAANPGFLLIRADYRAATGSPQLALADYRETLRLDPNNRFARMSLIYFLIDRRDLAALRRELPLAVQLAETDPDFQGVVGSAYLTLDEAARALPYFAAAVKRNPDDYLWLLNYADVLDRNLHPDYAWRVRRHAWVKIRQQVQQKERPPLTVGPSERPPFSILLSQARLASQFAPGDEGLALIRHLMRQDGTADQISDDPMRQSLDAGTRELVLAWLVSTEQHIGAKAWLWTQYARGLAAPKWAQVSVALALSDLETLQRALEEYADEIPRYDRHEAARRTQQYRLAQDIAFTELEKYTYDDEMHLRLVQSTFDMVSHSQAGYTSFTRGPVRGHEWTGEVAVWLSPRLRLSLDVSDLNQGLSSTAALAFVPASDRLYGVTALWRHAVGETRFGIFHREALAETTGFTLVHQHPLGPRLDSRAGIGYNERTLETAALAAGAVRDRAFVDMQYSTTWRTRLRRVGELNAYLTERFTRIMNQLNVLRLSHDALEHDLITQPATLRDALYELRLLMAASTGGVSTGNALPAAQEILVLLAHHCQLEAAAIYEIADGVYVQRAKLGEPPLIKGNDSLLEYALEKRSLAHLQTEDVGKELPTEHLVVAPILTSGDHLLGVLVVTRMPFFALNEDTLRTMSLLLGLYADSVVVSDQVGEVMAVVPGVTYDFADELVKLQRLQRDFGINSHCVVLQFGTHPERVDMILFATRLRRRFDVQWQFGGGERQSTGIANLMPLASDTAVRGYLERMEAALKDRFGGDFEQLRVRPYVISLEQHDPLAVLGRIVGESA